MKIKCIGNTGESLTEKSLNIRDSINTKYDLTINKEYIVYGISVYRDTLNYMVIGEAESPFWYAAELFEITDHLLSNEWYYNFLGYDNYVSAISGYKELALDPNHNNALMEGGDGGRAFRIFLTRKKEIDEWEKFK